MKIKTISEYTLGYSAGVVDFSFNNKINRWILDHENKVVIKDIKYAITDDIRSAMILYEEVKK